MSPATADRLLREIKKKEKRSKGTTRWGKLLKSQVPLRTFAEWEEVKTGFLEADLVAHCGESAFPVGKLKTDRYGRTQRHEEA